MILDSQQYRIIVESSPNMIWRAGKDALCDYFNTTWLNFTGRTMEQEDGNGWTEDVHPEDMPACLKIYLEAFETRKPFEMEYRLKRGDGQWRWINDRGVPIFDDAKEFAGYIGSCIDVTDRVEGQILRERAQKDGLTGINNRQYFEQLARAEFLRAKRFHQDQCVVMMDIDRFKSINDRYGHQTGDLVLKQTALILKENIREFDIPGRFGGDEFILLLTSTNLQNAANVIRRIERKIGELRLNALSEGHEEIKVSLSSGVYQLLDEGSLEKLIAEADKKLYEKKRAL